MKKSTTTAIAVASAAAAGFVAGILTAPKSGKETRADIKNGAIKLKKSADKNMKLAKEATIESLETIKLGMHKLGDTTAETARGVKSNVEKRFK